MYNTMPIIVEPVTGPAQIGPTPIHTTLFRYGNCIPEVCEVGLLSRNADGLTVMSVGCSFGPEVDSVLSCLEKAAPDIGAVSMMGIDVFRPLLNQASVGTYVTERRAIQTEDTWNYVIPEALSLFDLEQGHWNGQQAYYIDATNLRSRHKVSFIEADLSKDAHGLPKANIILCNFVLPHLLVDDTAESLFEGMAEQLAPNGIVSIGATLLPKNGNARITKVAQYLELEPVLYSVMLGKKFPFIFRKSKQTSS